MEERPYDSTNPDKWVARAVHEMHKVGAVYLEGSYEGGNDDGGLQEIAVLRNAAGQEIDLDLDWSHPLFRAADDVLSTKFGTWAGDWSANGTLYIDVAERRAWTVGVMQTYEDDDHPLEVTF